MSNFFDIIVPGILVFVIAVAALMMYVVVKEIDTASTGLLTGTAATVFDQIPVAYALYDQLNIVVFVFAIIAGAVAGFMVRSHPVFFIMFIFISFAIGIVLMVMSNVWQDMMATPTLAGYKATFSMTDWMFQWFPAIGIISAVLVAIATYAKPQGEGGGAVSV